MKAVPKFLSIIAVIFIGLMILTVNGCTPAKPPEPSPPTNADIERTAPPVSGNDTGKAEVTDSKGGEASKSPTINTAAKPRTPPKLVSFTVTRDRVKIDVAAGDTTPIHIQQGFIAEIKAIVDDPDGVGYTMRWAASSGGTLEGVGNTVRFSAFKKDIECVVTATVVDNTGAYSKTNLYFKVPCCGQGTFGERGQ